MGYPDEDVYPTATGRALETVKQHEGPQDLVFWAGWVRGTSLLIRHERSDRLVSSVRSCSASGSCSKRAVYHTSTRKLTPTRRRNTSSVRTTNHKPHPPLKLAALSDINPKGLVPAIEYKGRALYESLIICEFLEDAYPSYTPHLFPTDPFDRAYVRLWVDHVSKNVVPAFHRLLQGQTPEAQAAAREEYYGALRKVSEKVKGPYFLGDAFSMVDVVLAPWVIRDYLLQEHRGYSREAVGGGWKEYAEALGARESVLKTQSVSGSLLVRVVGGVLICDVQNLEHYEPIYARYLRDEAQSEVAKATRAGRAIP